MIWRIYRLPGSKQFLHIDSGQGTPIINVTGFEIFAHSHWGQNCGAYQPRGWIEVETNEFFISNGIAIFFDKEYKEAMNAINETLKIVEVEAQKVCISPEGKQSDTSFVDNPKICGVE
jgi:hypothetical protein